MKKIDPIILKNLADRELERRNRRIEQLNRERLASGKLVQELAAAWGAKLVKDSHQPGE